MQALLDANICAELPPAGKISGKISEFSSKFPQAPQASQAASVNNDHWPDSGGSLASRRGDVEKKNVSRASSVGEESDPVFVGMAPTAAGAGGSGGSGVGAGGAGGGGDGAGVVGGVGAMHSCSHPLRTDGDSSRGGFDSGQAVEGEEEEEGTADPAAVAMVAVRGSAVEAERPSSFSSSVSSSSRPASARRELHKKGSLAKLDRRKLVFPALLQKLKASSREGAGNQGHGGGGISGWKGLEDDDERFLCGRRVACRSPMLLPGLFHMVQARLANK